MYQDHEFDPVTDKQREQQANDKRLARRIRSEVRRVQSGEADDDIQDDIQQEQAEQAEREAVERKEKKRRSGILWLILSGNILIKEGMSEYYRYMICIAVMFFASIFVMFMSLHLDMRYSRLEREVKTLREKSIRIQEQKYRRTSHSAITKELRRRGIELYDPSSPNEIVAASDNN